MSSVGYSTVPDISGHGLRPGHRSHSSVVATPEPVGSNGWALTMLYCAAIERTHSGAELLPSNVNTADTHNDNEDILR